MPIGFEPTAIFSELADAPLRQAARSVTWKK